MWSKGHVTLWVGAHQYIILPKLAAIGTPGSENVLSLSRDQKVMWLYGWEPTVVSHHPAKFGGHRHCDSGDINIPANTVIFLQMRDTWDSICPPSSAIIILCNKRVSNINLKIKFYGKLFSVSNDDLIKHELLALSLILQ